jgi:hypothetical protein
VFFFLSIRASWLDEDWKKAKMEEGARCDEIVEVLCGLARCCRRSKAAGCNELVESGIAKVYCGTTNEPQMRRNDSAHKQRMKRPGKGGKTEP